MPEQDRKGSLTSNTADAVNDIVDHLLANGVVATGIVVGSVLLAADQELRMEQLAVGSGADLVDRGRVEIDEERPRDVFAVAGLGEESLVRPSVADLLVVGIRASIGSETVLKEVPRPEVSRETQRNKSGVDSQFPGTVTELGTSLAQMEMKNL